MEFRNSQAGSNARRYPEPTRQNAPSNESTTTQGGGAEAPVRNTMQMQNNGSSSKMNKPMMAIVAVVVVILVLLGGWFTWSNMMGDAGVKGGQYQAVFLTNGQVYFGKVSDINSGYVKLADIYYLQVQQSVQPDAKSSSSSNNNSQVSLAKLGSELHGPEDTMYISRQQVLFWENLKNDGKVVQAINSYKQQNNK